jgi:glutaredoxin
MPKEQQCTITSIWLTWLLIPVLAIFMGWRAGWPTGVVMAVVGVLFQMWYVRIFPRVSRAIGYGSVEDRAPDAGSSIPADVPLVTIYTASACPFCPIVKRRLSDLQQQQHRFDVREIDVTFRPELVRAKGIRSIPVVEVNGRTLVGNATSAQLADFLRNSTTAVRAAPRAS